MTELRWEDIHRASDEAQEYWAGQSRFDPGQDDQANDDPGEVITATPYTWRDPTTIPVRPWIWGRWLLRGTAASVIATGGTGKTTLLCSAALSLVTGRELLGKTVWGGPQRVWIWNLEDPMEEMERGIQASALHYGVGREDIEGRLFVDTAMDGKGLCTAIEGPDGFKLLAPVYERITAEIKRRQIDVLIVDPFVSSHEVDENANSKIDAVAKAWARTANDAGCVVILVHHTSKAGAADVNVMSARGAKALTDACRSALVLNRMDEETANSHGFDDKERRRYFTFGDDKHNRAAPESAAWFKLESVALGNGGLAEGDSVGVAVPWKAPDPFEGLTTNHLYQAQCKIDAGEYRADPQADDWAGKAVGEVTGLDPEDKMEKQRIKKVLDEWKKNGMFKEVTRKDKKSKDRQFLVVGKWANDFASPPRQGG